MPQAIPWAWRWDARVTAGAVDGRRESLHNCGGAWGGQRVDFVEPHKPFCVALILQELAHGSDLLCSRVLPLVLHIVL